ncbi:MAG: hypothetical protein M1814_000273 [Vezdaea aestivalis]|nr:MAG: hypothetical protein M1814_000273 [Vezdaea aestivalis]
MTAIRANARKVICIGRNYSDHVKELANELPTRPFYFLKPPSSIVAPKTGPVLRPQGIDLHYEVELGLVMGKDLSEADGVDEAKAMDAISGYVIGIDMTARNLQNEARKKQLPWSEAKGFDTFLPISNFIPKSKIPDPQDVNLHLSVNGKIRQSDSTSLMIFRIPQLLSTITEVMILEKGDIVMTGTPKGVGEVKPGDIMRAGLNVDGKDISEGDIEIEVRDRQGRYVFEKL